MFLFPDLHKTPHPTVCITASQIVRCPQLDLFSPNAAVIASHDSCAGALVQFWEKGFTWHGEALLPARAGALLPTSKMFLKGSVAGERLALRAAFVCSRALALLSSWQAGRGVDCSSAAPVALGFWLQLDMPVPVWRPATPLDGTCTCAPGWRGECRFPCQVWLSWEGAWGSDGRGLLYFCRLHDLSPLLWTKLESL